VTGDLLLAAAFAVAVTMAEGPRATGIVPPDLPHFFVDDPASLFILHKPTGSDHNKRTQCAALATFCDNWPQQVCMWNGGSVCECL
jgi:hypothetical protein